MIIPRKLALTSAGLLSRQKTRKQLAEYRRNGVYVFDLCGTYVLIKWF